MPEGKKEGIKGKEVALLIGGDRGKGGKAYLFLID